MKRIKHMAYLLFRELFLLGGYLPFPILFLWADCILYPLVYRLVGYRKKVVRHNLANSFPDYTPKQLLELERRFYHFFCDQIVETIKLSKMSSRQVPRYMRYENTELLRQLADEGRSMMVQLGHYGNWEYLTTIPLFVDKNLIAGQIYRRLNSTWFDRLFLDIRQRFGSKCIEKNDTLREILRTTRTGAPLLIGFMSDQTPSPANIHYWTTFLSQDTPMLIGVERIAARMKFAVLYLDMIREGRGRYVARFELLTKDASTNPEFEITELYARKMEQTILRDPAYWLWSHKRWKHKSMYLPTH